MTKVAYYISKENGNLVTWDEMIVELSEMYDFDDPTNQLTWGEYYEFYDYLEPFN